LIILASSIFLLKIHEIIGFSVPLLAYLRCIWQRHQVGDIKKFMVEIGKQIPGTGDLDLVIISIKRIKEDIAELGTSDTQSAIRNA